MIRTGITSFAHREVVAPVGLWERGVEASGYIPPSTRLLPRFISHALHGHLIKVAIRAARSMPARAVRGLSAYFRRASKALATSPAGETRPLRRLAVSGGAR